MSYGLPGRATLSLLCVIVGSTWALERTAFLRHGSLSTSRVLLEHSAGRSLAERAGDAGEGQVWAVGLLREREEKVWHTLSRLGGKVLHPLPGRHAHHWLVLASEDTIKQLLAAHEETTAALVPNNLKIAPEALSPQHISSRPLRVVFQGAPVDPPQFTVLVALLPLASASDLEQLIQKTRTDLKRTLSSKCKLGVTAGKQFIRVKVCIEAASAAANYVASLKGVTWVDAQSAYTPRNLVAGSILQASGKISDRLEGKIPAIPPPSEILKGVKSGFFPFWKAGITGKGEVVGVVDTGIDMDSCFMWDPKYKDYQNGSSTQWMPLPPFLPRNANNESASSYMYPVSMPNNIWMFQNRNHRKVVQYVMWSDAVDAQTPQNTEGHGTHISTTIAGSPYGVDAVRNPSIGTGIAPEAKIAMFDVGSSDPSGNAGLDIYTDKGQDPGQLYEVQRKVGARVTSTSIGPPDKSYLSPTCYLLDAYAWAVPDTLHVVAAGNAGADRSKQQTTGTVEAPATCKNVLSVGATESWVDVGDRSALPYNLLDSKGKMKPFSLRNYNFPHVLFRVRKGTLVFKLANGTKITTLDGDAGDFEAMDWASCCSGLTSEFDPLAHIKLQLVLPTPASGCNITKPFPKDTPVMVLLKKTAADNADIDPNADYTLYGYADYDDNPKTCNAAASITSVKKHNAAAALFYWTRKNDTETFADVPINTQLPTGIIHKSGIGPRLEALLRKGKTVFVEWLPAPRSEYMPPYENVAWYSSYGSGADESSGFDSRIKPEIVAPGYVTSAHSDGKYSGSMDKCAVVAKAGTSMAAPVVAGAAALVRQYFKDGFYPTGQADSSSKHDPSAPLVKAVLIAGTAAMMGVSVIDNRPLAPPPSPYQGYGRLDLSMSLPLKNTPHWRLQVVDGAVFRTDSIAHTYEIEVLKNTDGPQQPFVVVLVWHDFPGFPGARQVLVNNLDLVVMGPNNPQTAGGGGPKDGPSTGMGPEQPAPSPQPERPPTKSPSPRSRDLPPHDPSATAGISGAGNSTSDEPLQWGNDKQGGDFLNNVEKVFIPGAEPGMYKISVRASYLFIGARPQPYSLVVLGDIKGTLDSQDNPAKARRRAFRRRAVML